MIAVLVSVGCHPVSLRPGRASSDAQAVEVAMRSGHRVVAVHAGQTDSEPALRDYLGMGVASLDLLAVAQGVDVTPALADHLASISPVAVLCGGAAERGEGSGLLPYLVARRLGWPILTDVVRLAAGEGGLVEVEEALAGGRRQRRLVQGPVVAVAGRGAPEPRLSAYGPARRGQVRTVTPIAGGPPSETAWARRPARARPVIRAPMAMAGGAAGALPRQESRADWRPEEAARAILDYLIAEGCLAAPRQPPEERP